MHGSRWTAVALTMVFVLSVGGQCVNGLRAMDGHMACCATGDHNCEMRVASDDCCHLEGTDHQRPLAKLTALAGGPLALVTNPGLATIPSVDRLAVTGVASPLPDASPPPKYILLGSLLI